MWKRIRLLLIVGNFLFVFCVFSQNIYAGVLHFIAYGDTRQDIRTMRKPQAKHNAIAHVIREMEPDLVLFSGDMVYYNEFERFLEIIEQNYAKDKIIPFYPAIGNHELILPERVNIVINKILKAVEEKEQSSLSASPAMSNNNIEELWAKLAKEMCSATESEIKAKSYQVLHKEILDKLDPAYSSYLKTALDEASREQSWYSFFREANGLPLKFIVLNSSLPDDEEQFQWFLNELKQFSGPKIILDHYPPYSIGTHGCKHLLDSNSLESRFRDRYTRFFNDASHNVVLIINGHDHNYQKFCRASVAGDVQLPVYIISGGGGANLGGKGECDISQIPLGNFRCAEFVSAYHFLDVIVDTDEKNRVIFTCKVLGRRYDTTQDMPDDATFKKDFVKDRLELVDDFTLHWQK